MGIYEPRASCVDRLAWPNAQGGGRCVDRRRGSEPVILSEGVRRVDATRAAHRIRYRKKKKRNVARGLHTHQEGKMSSVERWEHFLSPRVFQRFCFLIICAASQPCLQPGR